MDLIYFIIILLLLFNIIIYIPSKLKEQKEHIALYNKELEIRFNRLEEMIKDKKMD